MVIFSAMSHDYLAELSSFTAIVSTKYVYGRTLIKCNTSAISRKLLGVKPWHKDTSAVLFKILGVKQWH